MKNRPTCKSIKKLKREKADIALLSGSNPQIAKADGDDGGDETRDAVARGRADERK